MWKVFICHDSENKDFVDPLVTFLQKKGSFLWYDEISILKGDPIHDKIQKGLKEAKGGIVIFSPDFIKEHSQEEREWVKEEFFVLIHKKNTENCFLIPVFYGIDPEYLPEKFKGPLDNINGFTFEKGKDTIDNLSTKIFKVINDIQIEETKLQEKRKKWKKLLIISILLILSVGFYLFYENFSHNADSTQANKKNNSDTAIRNGGDKNPPEMHNALSVSGDSNEILNVQENQKTTYKDSHQSNEAIIKGSHNKVKNTQENKK